MVKHRIEHLSCSVAPETKFLCEPGGKGRLGYRTGLQEIRVGLPGVVWDLLVTLEQLGSSSVLQIQNEDK